MTIEAIFQTDLAIVNWVANNLHCTFLDWLMPLITVLGDSGLIWIVFSALLLAFKKTRRWGVVSAVALLLMVVVCEFGIKNIVGRARPFTHLPGLELLIHTPSSYSFPSGHTTSSFAGATVLLFMNKKLGICAVILAVLIGFSRLYLSVHFLTDILIGALLGVLCAYTARWLCERRWGKLPRVAWGG